MKPAWPFLAATLPGVSALLQSAAEVADDVQGFTTNQCKDAMTFPEKSQTSWQVPQPPVYERLLIAVRQLPALSQRQTAVGTGS